MFVSDTHHRHLLTPEQYCGEPQLQAEIQHLFQPAWHFICTTADLPNDGDFLTFDLLGTPLIVRNFCGELHAFLNVCAHRFCRLTGEESGHSKEFTCQYHGWQYDANGETRKIPDAPNFRPFKKGMVGLCKYRLETAGQLVFVNLNDEGPTLREYLGPHYEESCEMFSSQWEQIWSWQPVCQGNWKLAYEITLEGYHVQTVHPKTLGQFPLAGDDISTHHLLTDQHSSFRADRSEDHFAALDFERFAVRTCGGIPKCEYTHLNTYPHLGLISQNVVAIAQSVLPITTNTYRNLFRMFVYRGNRSGILPWVTKRFLKSALCRLWPKTFQEDIDMVTETQAGLQSPDHPKGGLISIREERVYHFQQFIQQHCRPQNASETGNST